MSERYYSLNTFRVCVDIFEEDIQGRVYSPMNREVIEFDGSRDLLLKVDELFENKGYPQAFQNKRSFDVSKVPKNHYRGVPEEERSVEKILKEQGKISTRDVFVESRRNSSWQGQVMDTDGAEIAAYDSEVELLNILTRRDLP